MENEIGNKKWKTKLEIKMEIKIGKLFPFCFLILPYFRNQIYSAF